MYLTHIAAALANSSVRTLSQQEELPLLRDHLLNSTAIAGATASMATWTTASWRTTPEKCANDGTTIIASL